MSAPPSCDRSPPLRARGGLALATALALAACGRGEPGAARVRLCDCAGELRAEPVPAARPLLAEEFDGAPEGWHVATDRHAVLAVDPAALSVTSGRDDGRTFVTLTGKTGGLYRIVPVDPDTPVLFEGTLRARGIAPARQPFFGAAFWLAELPAFGTPEEVFDPSRSAAGEFVARHPLPTALGAEGWQARRASFRTSPATRALLVGCQLSLDEPLAGGAVDIDRMALAQVSERELWELEAARAVAEAHRGVALPDPGAWQARRRVDAMLGGESRPAILCLPGERLRLDVDVPRGAAVLEAGLAPWLEAFRATGEPLVLVARVNGEERLRRSLALAPERSAIGWADVALDLAADAGERVTLELAVEGELPAVLGAPQVVARDAPAPGWNVLLVSIDTLRADRVGAYGSASGATPRLDALAAESLVFADATASAPYTLPAHASLFSGQFASVHGVLDQGRLLAPERSPVLARILAERGWRTQAFTAAGFLTPDFGFHAGFDGFSIVDPLRHPDSRFFAELAATHPDQLLPPAPGDGSGAAGVERVKRWIAAHAREPFFLFLHTYEVHDYDPPPGTLDCAEKGCTSQLVDHGPLTLRSKNRAPFPGTSEDRAHLSHLYDAALRDVDARIGSVLDELARLGIYERTLVVVTSDHGEELFERGFLQHGKSLHREVLAIPLFVRVPGRAPGRSAAPAMHVDVAPTILAALGIAADPRMQGRDLLAEGFTARPVWSEVDDRRARQASLRDGRWKLVRGSTDPALVFPSAREWTLYDLERDPDERTDVAAEEPARLAELRSAFEAFQADLDRRRDALGAIETGEVGEATRELLEHLGY